MRGRMAAKLVDLRGVLSRHAPSLIGFVLIKTIILAVVNTGTRLSFLFIYKSARARTCFHGSRVVFRPVIYTLVCVRTVAFWTLCVWMTWTACLSPTWDGCGAYELPRTQGLAAAISLLALLTTKSVYSSALALIGLTAVRDVSVISVPLALCISVSVLCQHRSKLALVVYVTSWLAAISQVALCPEGGATLHASVLTAMLLSRSVYHALMKRWRRW